MSSWPSELMPYVLVPLAQRLEIIRETIQALLSYVHEDAYRILDVNIRQHYYSKEIIESSLRKCNVFKINDDELLMMKNCSMLKGQMIPMFA